MSIEMEEVRLAYGRKEAPIQIPKRNLVAKIMPKYVPKVKDEESTIEKALENPIESRKLSKLVGVGDKVAILVDDWTRPTPKQKMIPIVLRKLNDAGVRDEDIMIIVATGARQLAPQDLIKRMIGKEVFSRVTVKQHDSGDWENMSFIGLSQLSTPVWINKDVVEADIKIGIGNIFASPYAGFSGGAKIILPGVSSLETIYYNHCMQISPIVKQGDLDNPARQDTEEIARMAKLDMIINTILNSRNELVGVVAGDVLKAHRVGVKIYREMYEVEVPEKADIVIATPGSPYDVAMDSLLRTILVAQLITKDHGTMILAAPCPDGWGIYDGGKAIFDRESRFKPMEILRTIASGPMPRGVDMGIGAYTLSIVHKIRDIDIVVVSDTLTEEELSEAGLGYGKTISEALANALKRYGDKAKIITVRNCATVIPLLKS